jgi:N12 class adenine-specific DNA methylase
LKEAFIEAISATDEDDSERKKAKDDESIMTKVGKASRTGDNWVNWEDTGFDHITVDEGHNFRNSFSKPRNKNKGDADEFKDIPGGSTSLRGLKLFAITQMIQKHNNGRNVHVLTATPFQNSPVEIYNMLSLVAREKLKEAGISNFHEFLTQFAELKGELSVDSKNNVVRKNVMKGFKNLPALQALLNQYIMKVDGEDAGIIRPDKEDHFHELNQTAEQRDVTEKIRA